MLNSRMFKSPPVPGEIAALPFLVLVSILAAASGSAQQITDRSLARGELPARVSRDVLLLPNDDTIAPLNRPFNLLNKSVTFTRDAGGSFSSVTGPLQIDEDRGSPLPLDPATLSATYMIDGFEFPFFDTTHRTLHISRFLAIFLAPAPPPARFRQYTDADLLLQTMPVIAPLLTTVPGQTNFRPPAVFVREMPDHVIVTWYEATRPVEIQAVLFRSGDIRFPYRSIGNTRGGALYITSGHEDWRTIVPLADVADGTNDFVTSNPPEIAAMMDMTNVKFGRIGGTNVVQFVIQVRSPLDRDRLGPHGSLGITIRLNDSSLVVATISGSGIDNDRLSGPRFSIQGQTPLMQVDHDTIVITFDQEYALRDPSSDGMVMVGIANQFGGDAVNLHGRLDSDHRQARTDFGILSSVPSFPGPISDAFIIPASNVEAAWQRAKARFHLEPEEIDGFVLYTNFPTIGNATASVGNAGVDNISLGTSISSALPREPNLIDMHGLRDFWNSNDDSAISVLMHEFGHRWMFFIQHLENGVATAVLNSGGHPAINVDTRAAFQVMTPYDCSVMGGATWQDNGDGTFTGPPDTCSWGYSWLDLYLMGLAAPEEVPDFFYLSDTDPPIDELDFVEGETLRATRRNVSLKNITDLMGLRNPAYPDTQRTFKVLFLLVYDPARPLPEEDIANVAHYAELFKERFATATGHRASVDTSLQAAPRRRPGRR